MFMRIPIPLPCESITMLNRVLPPKNVRAPGLLKPRQPIPIWAFESTCAANGKAPTPRRLDCPHLYADLSLQKGGFCMPQLPDGATVVLPQLCEVQHQQQLNIRVFLLLSRRFGLSTVSAIPSSAYDTLHLIRQALPAWRARLPQTSRGHHLLMDRWHLAVELPTKPNACY